jgi:hypothetical protein
MLLYNTYYLDVVVWFAEYDLYYLVSFFVDLFGIVYDLLALVQSF